MVFMTKVTCDSKLKTLSRVRPKFSTVTQSLGVKESKELPGEAGELLPNMIS